MDLDCVGRDPGLAVLEVEEGDAGDDGPVAETDDRARLAHLLPPERCCPRGARGKRRFRDHRPPLSILEQGVNVRIVFWSNEGHCGTHAVLVALEREPGVREARGTRPGHEETDGRVPDGKEPRSARDPVSHRCHTGCARGAHTFGYDPHN